MQIQTWGQLSPASQDKLLTRPAQAQSTRVAADVTAIIEAVRSGGDSAVRELTARFDGVALESLRVSDKEFERAASAMPAVVKDAVHMAIKNIEKFHAAQRPATLSLETMPGVRCERVSHPLDAVGLYVPGGSAPLPSTVMMLAVPARLAGCPVRVLCTPPGADGRIDPAILFAAQACGVHSVFKIGGAQAIAAMAYGTESVPRVAKLFGPGNQWVTCAKSLVSVDASGAASDMPAGPSELLVIADETADPAFCAADLLSQAEHGPDSQVILITDSVRLAESVRAELQSQASRLSRSDIVAAALAGSACIVVQDLAEAISISNRYAPEHLILNIADARERLGDVRNAGSVFVGPWAPESVGDYCSGTNHVLPTYGWARSYSGLGLADFMRTMTVQELSAEGLGRIGEAVMTLAGAESLDAHAQAVRIRLDNAQAEVA